MGIAQAGLNRMRLRRLGGFDDSGEAPGGATYWLETADADLPNAVAIDTLTDGIIKHASGTPARAVPGTDYLYPAGVAGGQTWIGGTAAGDDATISSTAHATKGSIFLGATPVLTVDEVNARVSIGAGAVPTELFEVWASAGFYRLKMTGSAYQLFANAASETNPRLAFSEGGNPLGGASMLFGTPNFAPSKGLMSYSPNHNVAIVCGPPAIEDVNVMLVASLTGIKIGANGRTLADAAALLEVAQRVSTSGSAKAFLLTSAAHTGQIASTEAPTVDFDIDATVTFATGALATQRAFIIRAPTYAFAGASTIDEAATFYVSGAPIEGANATIEKPYSIWADAGVARFDGDAAGVIFQMPIAVATVGAASGVIPIFAADGTTTHYIQVYDPAE